MSRLTAQPTGGQQYRRGGQRKPASEHLVGGRPIAQVVGASAEQRLYLERPRTLQTQRIVVAGVRQIAAVPDDAHFAENYTLDKDTHTEEKEHRN